VCHVGVVYSIGSIRFSNLNVCSRSISLINNCREIPYLLDKSLAVCM